MYLDRYFEAMDSVLNRIRTTQRAGIVYAAEAIAASLAQKGVLAVMDTGHMLKHEAQCRAGGLMVITPFSYTLQVENPMDQRPASGSTEAAADIEARTVALALDSSKLKRGDVLIINSNSGRTANVIEVALQCRERAITAIGIASSEQMARCAAAHRTGKKLVDVVDICIDNCGPYGDAMIEADGNEKMCPASGIAGAYVFWSIHAAAVERLQSLGIQPTIYRSVHVSGHEYIEQQRKRFLEQGV